MLQCLRRCAALTPCDQLFTCVLPAYVAHTLSVMHFVNMIDDLATRNLRTHRVVVQMVDAQSFENCTTDRASDLLHGPREQQAAEELEVLVCSDHPARGRETKKADKLSTADEP